MYASHIVAVGSQGGLPAVGPSRPARIGNAGRPRRPWRQPGALAMRLSAAPAVPAACPLPRRRQPPDRLAPPPAPSATSARAPATPRLASTIGAAPLRLAPPRIIAPSALSFRRKRERPGWPNR